MGVHFFQSIAGRRLVAVAGSLVCLMMMAPFSYAEIIADSLDDWSVDGVQGERSWFNGYYNLTQDADGTYQAADFIEFLTDGSGGSTPVSPEGPNQWTGSDWNLTPSGGPWTFIGPEDAHPNGTNSAPNDEHWAIRRWVADSLTESSELNLTWHLRAQNLNGGGGTGGELFLNGTLLDKAVIGGTDDVGVTRSVIATVNPGDIIDLALTPENVDGTRSDGSDGSSFRLTIGPVPEPSTIILIGLGVVGALLLWRR